MGWLREKATDWAVRMLTKPRSVYANLLPNNLSNLYRFIRKGDVVLVDGDQRVSEVIKYLTQSTWSHAALYVGDEILRRFPERRADLVAQLGEDAQHMVMEALPEGVSASPLSKYGTFNLRICRPYGLQREHLQAVMDDVIAQMGLKYDVKNILDLARYFFPVSLIPRRFRRKALEYGSGADTSVICSSLIARAFQNIGFPVLLALLPNEEDPPPLRIRDRLLRVQRPYPALYHQVPTLITPRDFDLSPYFTIVKFNAIEASFDYRRIQWASITVSTTVKVASGGNT